MVDDKERMQPQTFLTKFLTRNNINEIREQTEINSAEELDYIHTEEFYGETLGIDFYMTGTRIYQGCKMSKDRGSRTEAVESIKGLNEMRTPYRGGLPTADVEDYKDRVRAEKIEH